MTRVNFVLTLYLLHLRCRNLSANEVMGLAVRPAPYWKKQCVVQAELVIDVSNHRERVSAGDEVLLDYDCSFSTYACEASGAVLENHVSGCNASAKVHPAILDNSRKSIAVGSYVRNLAGHMHDVGIARIWHEVNLAGAGKQAEVSSVT